VGDGIRDSSGIFISGGVVATGVAIGSTVVVTMGAVAVGTGDALSLLVPHAHKNTKTSERVMNLPLLIIFFIGCFLRLVNSFTCFF